MLYCIEERLVAVDEGVPAILTHRANKPEILICRQLSSLKKSACFCYWLTQQARLLVPAHTTYGAQERDVSLFPKEGYRDDLA